MTQSSEITDAPKQHGQSPSDISSGAPSRHQGAASGVVDSGSENQRLIRPSLQGARLQLAAAMTVAIVAGFAVAGNWYHTLAFFAVGAGAGYSLSGSV